MASTYQNAKSVINALVKLLYCTYFLKLVGFALTKKTSAKEKVKNHGNSQIATWD